MRRNEKQSRGWSINIRAVMKMVFILFVYKRVREIPDSLNIEGAIGSVVAIALSV